MEQVARVLLVEDNRDDAALTVRWLHRVGFRVTWVTSGAAAIEAVRNNPPDVIILDASMPGMSGAEVCQQLKSDPMTALIPITILTGSVDLASRRYFAEMGADDFLEKSPDLGLLQARVRTQARFKWMIDQLEQTEQVVLTLAMTLEAKDTITEAHVMRMRSFCEQLAAASGMDWAGVRAVGYGAMLHDIGKIGIREAILCKPAALDADEEAEMRLHPVIGAQIISPLRFSEAVMPIVRHHHERWDGGGYPDGLSGENIPFGARMVTIVDSYDAMTNDRPYRTARSIEEAAQELKTERGHQFDPVLVDRFLSLVGAYPL